MTYNVLMGTLNNWLTERQWRAPVRDERDDEAGDQSAEHVHGRHEIHHPRPLTHQIPLHTLSHDTSQHFRTIYTSGQVTVGVGIQTWKHDLLGRGKQYKWMNK